MGIFDFLKKRPPKKESTPPQRTPQSQSFDPSRSEPESIHRLYMKLFEAQPDAAIRAAIELASRGKPGIGKLGEGLIGFKDERVAWEVTQLLASRLESAALQALFSGFQNKSSTIRSKVASSAVSVGEFWFG